MAHKSVVTGNKSLLFVGGIVRYVFQIKMQLLPVAIAAIGISAIVRLCDHPYFFDLHPHNFALAVRLKKQIVFDFAVNRVAFNAEIIATADRDKLAHFGFLLLHSFHPFLSKETP